jgi:hypothetical protein
MTARGACLLTCMLFASCRLADASLEGKVCPCSKGFVCDTDRDRCVRTLPAKPDAGMSNGVTVLASAELSPSWLAVSSTHLIWSADGALRMCALPDCSTVTTAATQIGAIGGIALYGGILYWTGFDDGTIHSVPLNAPADKLELAAGQEFPMGITAHASGIYFANKTAVIRCSLADCRAGLFTVAAGESRPRRVAVGFDRVYWVQDDFVKWCPHAGCGGYGTCIVEGKTNSGIALDGDYLYWSDYQVNGTVSRSPLPVATGICPLPPAYVEAAGISLPFSMAVDARGFYWIAYGTSEIWSCPLTGCGGAPTLLVNGLDEPTDIVADGNAIYWTEKKAGTVKRRLH